MRILPFLLVALVLSGCGQSQAESTTVAASEAAVTHIDEQRRCHQCGMFITRYPGPKGVVKLKGQQAAMAFCSTGDLFQFILQPQNQRQVTQVWVHDLAQTDWDKPADSAFMDAHEAWYVAGSSRHGAMGPTLASFSSENVANAFANSYGGKVLRFDQLTLDNLGTMAGHGHKH
ncbi:copper chaperone NosL [Ferrimonas sediminum]|uniref:Copper chaperone NosL n=1 Tax=Ferrimonas sediminum TaxID=718193 RepID=A0A1G8Z6Z2_9GAMM|nr:nitrous oxide reductase accessory protein NosL [Ferrimonas sediminum]SDK10859.1 copper chaperone NosL [Ferrimonas sediminum]